jgi:CBS domain-containing protein
MKVSEIMSRNVECIEPETLIAKAAGKMREHDIGFLPICESGRPIGAVTDRDIAVRCVAEGRDPRLAPVSEIMTPAMFSCYDDDDVEDVGRYMQETRVHRMVILDRQGKIVGVVSIGDIAKTTGVEGLAGETLGEIAEAA